MDDVTAGGRYVYGPHGAFVVCQSTRRGISGWVVSRKGSPSEDDPIYDYRHHALVAAKILSGSEPTR